MTADIQTKALAAAIETSFVQDGRLGYTCHDLADQYVAALPAAHDFTDDLMAYARWVRLADRPDISQMEVDFLRRKCVLIALEIAYHRGELDKNWIMEN
ncbi:hypothetical protein [Arthrobacter sp. UYCo732]|uniref:hypothetical protein n=1 Tax=Arthrobacter sp. UYCo732 TaxID=3156336 RepID=UPI0033938CE3